MGEPEVIELKNLASDYYRLRFLTDTGDSNIQNNLRDITANINSSL